jgi:hypothetical protein
MKLHKQHMDLDERIALKDLIHDALMGVSYDANYGSNVVALDADFLPTNNINEARWLYSENFYGSAVVRINADGSMTQIERQ